MKFVDKYLLEESGKSHRGENRAFLDGCRGQGMALWIEAFAQLLFLVLAWDLSAQGAAPQDVKHEVSGQRTNNNGRCCLIENVCMHV